jgi:hypothetical protein
MANLKQKDSRIARDIVAEGTASHSSSANPTHEEIAALAYEIYISRGAGNGGEVEDWLQAESELLAQAVTPTPKSKSTAA